MNFLFIIIAIAAVPLVFLTMYSRTAKGIKVRLGSYFIIRKFTSDYLKVRSLKDLSLLILRLCFAALIMLLIFDPSDIESPGRNVIFHDSSQKKSRTQNDKYYFELVTPPRVMDRFDEDLYFIEAFLNNQLTGSRSISLIYNPSEKMIDGAKNDIIVFPSKKQGRSAFMKWIEILDVAPIRISGKKIKNTDIIVKACYPILIKNHDKAAKCAELEDGSVIAVSFEHNDRRVLLFGIGLSSFWGEFGLSGYFIEILENFKNHVSMSGKQELQRNTMGANTAGVKSLLSFEALIIIASIIFLIELIVFVLKSVRMRKAIFLIFILLASTQLFAEDFKFIELDIDGNPHRNNKLMFSIIKHELERKTTIRISPDYYKSHSAKSLIKGIMPEFPYLWFFGCGKTNRLSHRLTEALLNFVKKGGMIFVDLQGMSGDSACYQFFNELGMKISGDSGLTHLPKDHPIYKSFFLLNAENFSGINVSISTKRTALIISKDNLRKRTLNHEENAIRAGINIVLYMLSGNYKSDQIHTRQILKKLKKRELYR